MPTAEPIAEPATAVLRLRVRNHPGVMSHVCGLFARRAFNAGRGDDPCERQIRAASITSICQHCAA